MWLLIMYFIWIFDSVQMSVTWTRRRATAWPTSRGSSTTRTQGAATNLFTEVAEETPTTLTPRSPATGSVWSRVSFNSRLEVWFLFNVLNTGTQNI